MYRQRVNRLKTVLLFSFLISSVVFADDLEIYSGKRSHKPNVLVVMIVPHKIGTIDNASSIRMQKVQETLQALLARGKNINVGLLLFSDYGGSILYPIKHVDSPIKPIDCGKNKIDILNCIKEYIPLEAPYIKPIQDLKCLSYNHIVLVYDEEDVKNNVVSPIESNIGEACNTSDSASEKCGLDLIRNISDISDSLVNPSLLIHTIEFPTNSNINTTLNHFALHGEGGFYGAENSEQLLVAFETILSQVDDVNVSLVSPSLAVNQLNRMLHKNELYFALFTPAEGNSWLGNLKKYQIEGRQILDKNSVNAIDPLTGYFANSSQSFWSALQDGNDVSKGGAASKLTLNRNIYKFDDTPSIIVKNANVLHENNLSITAGDLSVDSLPAPATLRTKILKWARGVDVHDDDVDGSKTDTRGQMGDIIHSQPVIVNYSTTVSAVFVATNHGFLHSIDAENGSENFAIIPKELLGNLYNLYTNRFAFDHQYGLDGDMVIRKYDNKVYLYLGMRRGGNNYYVFDVSHKKSPKLVFSINGGKGDYANMGQTWSRPVLTQVQIGNTVKNVMVVGGGYDQSQDTKLSRSADSIGNSVFMIDADNGELLWSASNTNADLVLENMKYSVPARVSVVDRDNNGLADHLYVADMGGQLFRLDIYNGKIGSNLVKGGLIGSFSGDTAEDNRRFYYAPDVSEVSFGTEQYYAIAIGSGFRAGPLNTTIKDQFYLIKDTSVFNTNTNGEFMLPASVYTETHLYDATNHLLTSSIQSENQLAVEAFANKNGWRIRLSQGGEKVLASPLIVDYKVFFTTYLPAPVSDTDCSPAEGSNRAYLVDILNGNSAADINNNNKKEFVDRYAQLEQTGIAPAPIIVFENTFKPVMCIGSQCAVAVIDFDEEGHEVTCTTELECLAQNIFGRFERVQEKVWKTEIEKP